MSDDDSDEGAGPTGVVLDVLAHGRAEDDRPQYQKEPLAYAVDAEDFALYELVLSDASGYSIGDEIDPDAVDAFERVNEVGYDDLPSGATAELDYAIEEIVEADERRFVDFFNDAQAITTRLHALNLLPGIGKKLRNNILEERKRKPFESFDGLEDRVSGLHDPKEVLVERVLEELREDDLKYRTFVRVEEQQQ